MTTVERKEHIATWDGDASRWLDYVKRVRLQYERTEPKKRCLLGAELASRLTGKAWDITSAEVDHSRLQRADGAAYLLSFLEERLCKTPIPDVGQRLEEFFMKLRRQPGASMTEWATSLRESYRRLQRAMARQRQQNNPGSEVAVELNSRRPSASSPTPAQRSDRTTPQARRDAPVTFPDIPEGGSNPGRTGQVQETNEEPNDHEGYEELPQSEHGWSEQRWTADEWRQWQRDRWQRQEDDDTSSNWWDQKEETIRWEQFEFGEVQILPQEILGWLLLRRSGLPASARLSVLSAINNRLDLDTMERAMRDQEEELLVAEANRSRGDLHRPRRSFWVEQDSQWGLLGDLETEEVDDSAIYWVGDRLPQDVYPVWDDPSPTSTAWSTWAPDGQELSWQWMDDDFYAQDAEGIFWSWTETKEWMDAEECAQATPNDSEAIFSAFAAFQDKMRSFRDSRKLNYAKQHSRGFYPFSMFKGKSKGKGKKGKPKGVQASPSSTSSALANFQKGKGSSGSTQRPGHPEYRGCFICGSKDHDFRGCPKRRSETSTSNSSSTRPNYFSNQIFVVLPVEENEQQAMTATEDTTAALAAVAVEFPGHAVIDLGATESLASLEALQEIMNLRLQNFGHEEIVVHEETKRFKFGNGDTQKATSFIELPQTIDGTTLTLGVHAIDAPGVPLLLSVRTLRKMGASIDTELNRMQLRRFSDAWIPLKQSANEHLLLDMTRDWYHLDEPSVSAGAYMELFDGPEWDMWPDERVCEESFESQLHDAVPVHDMSMHEEFAASSQHVFCESLEEGDVVDKCVTEFASPDDPSSSSMHFGARAIVTLAAASTVLPLVHHGILSTDADQTKKPGCFAQGGCGEQSSRREGQIIFPEVQEGSDSNAREIRFLEGDRPGVRRPASPRISLLWQPPANATGKRIFEREEQIRNVDSVRTLPPQDRVCSSLWSDWSIQTSRSTPSRCDHRDGDHRFEKTGGRAAIPGEPEREVHRPDRSGGVPSQEASRVGSQEGQESTSTSSRRLQAKRCGDACNTCLSGQGNPASVTRPEEGHEEGERQGTRGGRILVGGLDRNTTGERRECRIPVNTNDLDHYKSTPDGDDLDYTIPDKAYDGERMGILSKPQQELLQGVVEEFMEEAHAAWRDLLPPQDGIDLLETCCPPDSRLTQVFLDAGRTALRVGLPAHDLSSKKGVLEIKEMISRWKPKVAWFSLPCGPYSPIQELFNEKDEKAMQRSLERKKKSKKLIKNGLEVATHQLECGGEVAWEWPTNNRGWNLQPVRAFWQRLESSGDLHIARADGCAFDVKDEKTDLPIKKPWTIKTTSRTLTQAVSRTCPGHLVHPEHQECLGGGLARKSGFYPKKFCQAVLRAIREMTDVGAQGVLPAYPVFDTRDMDIEEKEVKKKRVTPLSEVERKGVEKMLERLRKRTGHPSNAALSGCLRHRGAHPEVIDMASRHQCPECQELRAAPLNPALSIEKSEMLWETLVIDNMGFTVDDTTYHYMAMIDEASRLLCVHPLFEHPREASRNATAEEVIYGLEHSWVMRYGLPGKLRMDPEGAFRSTALSTWADERGVELLPCAAEDHGQIGVIERAIRTLKSSTRQILQGGDVHPWQAIAHACQAHNQFERVEGYSPYQWAFGRQPTLTGRMHDSDLDMPYWTSVQVPGSSMMKNLKIRVQAQQAFLRHQSQELMSRAKNAKTRRQQVFLPGDLVCFKRVKPPAQSQAHLRLPHKLWRWYGPARVLASETRTDAKGMERKPSSIIWLVSQGRLKRCSPEQLRHASAREQAIAEGMSSPTTTWTFHSLAQSLWKGEYEILDDYLLPEDLVSRGAPKTPRSRSVGPEAAPSTPATMRRSSSVPRLGVERAREDAQERTREDVRQESDKTPKRLVKETSGDGGAHQKAKMSRTIEEMEHMTLEEAFNPPQNTTPKPRNPRGSSSSGIQSEPRSTGVDLGRLISDPSYEPQPMATGEGRKLPELFEQPLFKKQRRQHGASDDELLATSFLADDGSFCNPNLACAIELPLPSKSSEWRSLKRNAEAYFVKKLKGAEVKRHELSEAKKKEFDAAKQAEVSQWLAASAVKKAIGPIPRDRLVRMRWVLTHKESGAAKGRIVLIGYEDPDLASIQSAAPTMTRRTRQLALQYSSVQCWRVLKGDVKSAFLQGERTEENRNLFALPVPELARALGIPDGQAVQVVKSCYGLVNAPASWFQCIRDTLKDLDFVQSKTDPCLWSAICI